MSWRILLITSCCNLSFKDNQLLYKNIDGCLKIPIEDINTIVLDTKEINISTYLLSYLADNGVTILTTDDSHIPNGIFLPYMKYYKNSETAFLQKDWSEPFKKRLWQKIVQQKIINQAYNIKDVLKYENLISLSKRVTSGDLKNIEGFAAKEYWKNYYPNFVRNSDTKVNSALNYSYSIVRSLIAKNLSAIGFITSFGIHHCSMYNSFNLADDLIEPFRGIVESRIKSIYTEDSFDTNLTTDEKKELLKIMYYEVLYNKQKYSIMYVTQLLAENLLNVTKSKDVKKLILPEINNSFS